MLPVLIAGGGIGGLTTALALARHGIASHVYEARPKLPREGAGIQLGPNATRILRSLGMADALEPYTVSPDCIVVNDGVRGRELARLPLGTWIAQRHGAPYWVVHRAALLDALWSAAKAQSRITLGWGRTVAHIEDRADAAEVTVRFADGDSASGSMLIGADGLWSRVRTHVDPGFRLVYSGVAAARAVLSRDQVTPAFAAPVTGVWLAPNAHIVHYPVDGGERVAIVAIAACAEPRDGWSVAVEADDVAARFAGMPNAVRAFLGAAAQWRQWALFGTEGGSTWQRGRCVLIGDAAHPILPYLAQGGAMAIEDGYELAATMAAWDLDADQALPAFVRQRRHRVDRVQATSIANGQAYHLTGLAARARNAALRGLPGALFMRRYDWIYGHRSRASAPL